MKARLVELSAMPIDRLELKMLPPGELDVEIRLRCDHEAYAKLVAFFTEAGFEDGRASAPGVRALKP